MGMLGRTRPAHAQSTRSRRALCAATSTASADHGAVAKDGCERSMSCLMALRSSAGTSETDARTSLSYEAPGTLTVCQCSARPRHAPTMLLRRAAARLVVKRCGEALSSNELRDDEEARGRTGVDAATVGGMDGVYVARVASRKPSSQRGCYAD